MSEYTKGEQITYSWNGEECVVTIVDIKDGAHVCHFSHEDKTYEAISTYELDLYKYNRELLEQLERAMKSIIRIPRRRLDTTEESE